MERRQLQFADFEAYLADLDRLQKQGYEKAGTWDLAQCCDHLAYFIEGSLDGYTFRVPWLFKVLFGRLVLGRILKGRQMKAGITTPQKPLPEPGGDQIVAVTRLKTAIERFLKHQGEFHASPFFGYMTPQQWRELHLIHGAHHLSFLIPHGTTKQ